MQYVKLSVPWHRVPVLTPEKIAEYKRHNVDPHKGTSYGEVERVHWEELKLAAKLQCELIAMPKLESIEATL